MKKIMCMLCLAIFGVMLLNCSSDPDDNTTTSPEAAFSYEQSSTDFSVTFTNESTNATSFEWTLSNAETTTSTDENPVITFTQAGEYVVSLTAIGESGEDTIEETITIEDITSATVDITDAIFTLRSANCEDYIDDYSSSVIDVQNNTGFDGSIIVSLSDDGEKCEFVSNSIPNHDFNSAPAMFANSVAEVSMSVEMTTSPSHADSVTNLSLSYNNAIFLNGVKLDLLSAGCYGVGDGMIGCGESYFGYAWRYDPMSPNISFGTDLHNAHTQTDGAYHYHGDPLAMYEDGVESPVIGFAADGYPIYGPYINDNGTIREVLSSYTLKEGEREALGTETDGLFPGGDYDGTFIEDYEYEDGLGDLDACNGMYNEDGDYGYYVTNAYPWVIGCFSGTLDQSFQK